MDVDFFADFHLCNGCIEAADHLAHTADELERFAAVVGRIKLGSIVEGYSVVGTAGLTGVGAPHPPPQVPQEPPQELSSSSWLPQWSPQEWPSS